MSRPSPSLRTPPLPDALVAALAAARDDAGGGRADGAPDVAGDHAALATLWAALESGRAAPRPAEERAAGWARVAAAIAADGAATDASPGRAASAPPVAPVRSIAPPPAWRAPVRRRAGRLRPVARVALACCATAVAVVSARALTRDGIAVPAGARQAVTLPDGSVAELNAGSSLRWARGFRPWLVAEGATREVWLEGEAFFRVTRGARPFVVRTWNARVTVLGTRFAVRARDERAGGTAVTVEEGRVRLAGEGATRLGAADAGAARAVVLGAGERSAVAAGATAPTPASPAPVARALAWRGGGFVAVDLPLDAIARELERRFAVEIVLRDRGAGVERLTLYYPPGATVDAILTDICTARALRFRRTSRGYEVF